MSRLDPLVVPQISLSTPGTDAGRLPTLHRTIPAPVTLQLRIPDDSVPSVNVPIEVQDLGQYLFTTSDLTVVISMDTSARPSTTFHDRWHYGVEPDPLLPLLRLHLPGERLAASMLANTIRGRPSTTFWRQWHAAIPDLRPHFGGDTIPN